MAETDKDDLISIIEDDGIDEDIPTVLPLMPVRDVVIFSDMLLPLFVGRERSVRAVEEAVSKSRFLIVRGIASRTGLSLSHQHFSLREPNRHKSVF